MIQPSEPQTDWTWFWFLIAYIIIDFARPQDLVPGISFLKPGMLSVLGLTFFIISTSSYWFRIVHIRMIWYTVGLLILWVFLASNNNYAYMTAKGMLLYMPYILSVVACLVNLKTFKKFININILVMIYISITGIVRGGRGTGGYFHDENDIALYINTMLPFCYFFLIYQKELGWRLIYAAGVILGITADVVSFSRGGFVGLAVIAAGIWFFGKKKVLTLCIFCIIASGMYFWVGEAYIAEIKTITDTSEGTASWRLMAWKSGVRMFLHNPFGVGGNNYQIRLPEYQPKDYGRLDWGRPAHSLWVTLLSELGIIGVILFVRLIYNVFKDMFHIVRAPPLFDDPDYMTFYASALALICGYLGFFASGTFLSVLYYPYLWYYAAIAASLKRIEFLKIQEQAQTQAPA